MSKKLSLEEVKQIIKEICNYTILDNKYKNSSTKMTCIDAEGYKYYCSLDSLRNSGGSRKFSKTNPYTIENIKLWIELNKRTDILLSDEFLGNGSKDKNQKLSFICKNGHNFKISWSDYKQGKGCAKCVRRYENKEEYIEVVKEMYGDEYSVIGDYVDSQTKILMKHNKCGYEWYTKPNSITQGHGCPQSKCCKKHGEEHYKWNPNLTDEDRKRNSSRLTQPGYKKWRGEVLGKYNNKCVICGKKKTKNNKLIPHHLNSWDTHIEERFDVENGVAICEEHHKEFHMKYGYGNNTKEQFVEYLNDNKLKINI